MDISIEEYKNEYESAINELIADDSFVMEDIIACLKKCPQYGVIVKDESEIIGFIQILWFILVVS